MDNHATQALISPNLQHAEIEELYQRARAGDKAAQEQFCALARKALLIIARKKLPGLSHSFYEDLVQDILMAFLEKKDVDIQHAVAYLRGILHNKIGNEIEKLDRARLHDHVDDLDLKSNSHRQMEKIVEDRDFIELCRRAASRMTEPDRTLLLRSFDGALIHELCTWYQTYDPKSTNDAFRQRLYRARQKLWELVNKDRK